MKNLLKIMILLLSTVSHAEFKGLSPGKIYKISYFDFKENIDVKKNLKIISTDQDKLIMLAEDRDGNVIEITRKSLSPSLRKYAFKIDYKEPQKSVSKKDNYTKYDLYRNIKTENKFPVENVPLAFNHDSKGPHEGKVTILRLSDSVSSLGSIHAHVNISYEDSSGRKSMVKLEPLDLNDSKIGAIFFPNTFKYLRELRKKAYLGSLSISRPVLLKEKNEYSDEKREKISYKTSFNQIANNIKDLSCHINLSNQRYHYRHTIKLKVENKKIIVDPNPSPYKPKDKYSTAKSVFDNRVANVKISSLEIKLNSNEIFKIPDEFAKLFLKVILY